MTRRERRERERMEPADDGVGAVEADVAAFADPLLSLEAPAKEQVDVEEASPAVKFAESHVLDDAPTSGAYDLGVRYDDLLGDGFGQETYQPAAPRSSFAHVGESAFAIVMYILFLPLSFLIPSSSGLATVAMPIMAPLADFVGADRSLVVTSYQSASGLLNLVTPTSAVVMGGS